MRSASAGSCLAQAEEKAPTVRLRGDRYTVCPNATASFSFLPVSELHPKVWVRESKSTVEALEFK